MKLHISEERGATIKNLLCKYLEKDLQNAVSIGEAVLSDVEGVPDEPCWVMEVQYQTYTGYVIYETKSLQAYIGITVNFKPATIGKHYKMLYGDMKVLYDVEKKEVYLRRRFWDTTPSK